MIEKILAYNQAFVANKEYKPYTTSKYPDRKLAIITCMDTRLIELLPAALGIKNGDAKIIKNAGGVIVHPFGSAVRSLLIAIYELNVEEVMIIGHTDCGVSNIDVASLLEKMKQRGISETALNDITYCGICFDKWLGGFNDVEESVKESLDLLKRHPLIPKEIKIHGFVMDSRTGALQLINQD